MKLLRRSFALWGLLASLALNSSYVFAADSSYRKRDPVCPAFARIAEWVNFRKYLRPVDMPDEDFVSIGLLVQHPITKEKRLYLAAYVGQSHRELFMKATRDFDFHNPNILWGGEMGFTTTGQGGVVLEKFNSTSGFLFERMQRPSRANKNNHASLEKFFKEKGVPWDANSARHIPHTSTDEHLIKFADGTDWDPRHNDSFQAAMLKIAPRTMAGSEKITIQEVEKLATDLQKFHFFESLNLLDRHMPGITYPGFGEDMALYREFERRVAAKDMSYLENQQNWIELQSAMIRFMQIVHRPINPKIMHF